MSVLEGDGREGQPAEGVASLDSIAEALEQGGAAQVEPEESDEPGEAEGEEVEGEETEAESEEEAEEPTFTIKVDGKDVTLKQSELIEQAQKGFDYTQKTMAVAEERKAVAAERELATKYRQQKEEIAQAGLQRLQALEQFLQQQVGESPPLSWAEEYGTNFYLAQKEQHEHRKGQLEQVTRAIAEHQQEAQRERQAWIAERIESTEKALRDTLPGWNDGMAQDYLKYADGLGLSVKTADTAFLNPGMWELIHKAKAYDDLQAKKREMKPVAQLPKVAKPGTTNTSRKDAERAKREQAFDKNPSVDALAALLR